MEAFIINNEVTIRLLLFFSFLIVMGSFELLFPKRELLIVKSQRWINNLGVSFLNSLIIKLLFPISAVAMAMFIEEKNFGLFKLVDLSPVFIVILSIILLDLIIYWQHRLFHKIDFFWKFHKVHHSDLDYDLTTGVRFHPVEIIFSMVIKLFFIALLGVPAVAVVIFEILLSSFAIFNHSNIALPKSVDKILRVFIVTPDFHRVHHSIRSEELHSNYGFNISLWDRVFRSYKQKPKDSYEKMTIGLKDLQKQEKTVSLFSILKLPFS